jgi:hypothetical protein
MDRVEQRKSFSPSNINASDDAGARGANIRVILRAALDTTLQAIPLRCICWLVEGQGFHAAMVRAVITGLRFLRYRKYPTHIASSLEDALAWMLPLLQGGAARLTELRSGAAYIRAQRESSRHAHSL